jgi:hypothetical protein
VGKAEARKDTPKGGTTPKSRLLGPCYGDTESPGWPHHTGDPEGAEGPSWGPLRTMGLSLAGVLGQVVCGQVDTLLGLFFFLMCSEATARTPRLLVFLSLFWSLHLSMCQLWGARPRQPQHRTPLQSKDTGCSCPRWPGVNTSGGNLSSSLLERVGQVGSHWHPCPASH